MDTDLPVVPARITTALDANDLYGPTVDTACGTWEGNPAGDVDAWELGTATPTPEQVALLAALTRMPVAYFHEPLGEPGTMWVCRRTGRKADRCRQTSTTPVPPAAEQPPSPQGALF